MRVPDFRKLQYDANHSYLWFGFTQDSTLLWIIQPDGFLAHCNKLSNPLEK